MQYAAGRPAKRRGRWPRWISANHKRWRLRLHCRRGQGPDIQAAFSARRSRPHVGSRDTAPGDGARGSGGAGAQSRPGTSRCCGQQQRSATRQAHRPGKVAPVLLVIPPAISGPRRRGQDALLDHDDGRRGWGAHAGAGCPQQAVSTATATPPKVAAAITSTDPAPGRPCFRAVFVPIVPVIAASPLLQAGWLLLGAGIETALIHRGGGAGDCLPLRTGLGHAVTAIMVGVGAGAKRGILIRDAAALEIAGDITIVAFDKTG